MIAFILVAAAGSCPFAPEEWVSVPTKKELPAGAAEVVGDMAEKGEPFQASDAVVPGMLLSFSRFVSAQGRGCELVVRYEQGGIGLQQLTMRLRFDAGRWVKVAGKL